MARIRSVKPDFWEDEKVASVCRDARLLFIGLWNHADDEGRMRANAKYVKSKVFPYDDDLDVGGLIAELACSRFIVLYRVAGQEYLWIVNFRKHQKIDRPQPSQLPGPPNDDDPGCLSDTSTTPPPSFDDSSSNDQRAFDPSRARAVGVGVDREWIGDGEGVEGEGEHAHARRPTLDDCLRWTKHFGGTDAQAEKLFWHYEGHGWPSNGLGIRVDAIVKKWLLGDAERAMNGAGKKGKKPPDGHTLQSMQAEIGQQLRDQGITFDGK